MSYTLEPNQNYPQHKPIQNTFSRRILTLTAIKILKRFRPRHGSVLFLSGKICVKYGTFQDFSEATTMQFIAQHTSIPVPKVYCSFKHKKWTYIVMERIQGEMLGRVWSSLSKDSKTKILRQLKDMITEMRKIPRPENIGVASVNGGTLYDARLPGTSLRFGPFKTVQDFHRYLRGGFEAHPDHFPEISELIALQDDILAPSCFTHADLSSLNILVRGDDVVGIVDWETAGWYPTYWEYTTAWHVNPRNEFWRAEVDQFVEPMVKELAMEQLRRKYFGDT